MGGALEPVLSAVFVDRDGVINRHCPKSVKSWEEFEFLPGALEALRALSTLHWPILIVTNQAAIGRGFVDAARVEEIHMHMIARIQRAGGEIRDVMVCPHRPEDGCDCRKPQPGLLRQAAVKYGLDLAHSYVIGDETKDIAAATAAECIPIRVLSGLNREAGDVPAYRTFLSLREAAEWLVRHIRQEPVRIVAARHVSDLTALVLAGGLGTRLRGVVSERPKVLAEVRGRPFLGYILDWLRRSSVREVVLCAGYMREQVVDYVGDGALWGLCVRYSFEDRLLGTGGALCLAMEQAHNSPVLALNGDTYCDVDVQDMLAFHLLHGARATVALAPVTDAARYATVRLGDAQQVVAFGEKASQGEGLVSAGVYILEGNLLSSLPGQTPLSVEKDVFPRLVGHGLFGYVSSRSFIDIGLPESLLEAQSVLLSPAQ